MYNGRYHTRSLRLLVSIGNAAESRSTPSREPYKGEASVAKARLLVRRTTFSVVHKWCTLGARWRRIEDQACGGLQILAIT
jgi:hypothetical protein